MLLFTSFPSTKTLFTTKKRVSNQARCQRNRRRQLTVSALNTSSLVIGVNKYSHDTSLAILDGESGKILYALSKERISRRKHDGGDISTLVPHALSVVADLYQTDIDEVASRIEYVIANNHHFRIKPFEERLPFQVGQGYIPESHLSPWNLIGSDVPFLKHQIAKNARKVELSHHLAHAYSAVYTAPFDNGLVIIMDGMGDAYDDWLRGVDSKDETYFTEESLPDNICCDSPKFHQYPDDLKTRPGVSFREAETAYTFRRNPDNPSQIHFQRVFKRWTPENAPSELMNHSFEEMDSLGAIYSRVSSLIFGDWNACGKVMGLAPWANSRRTKPSEQTDRYFMSGHLFDGNLNTSKAHKRGLEFVGNKYSDIAKKSELQPFFEDLAFEVQSDLESIVGNFVESLVNETSQRNVVFAGGVALNSTLNGVLASLQSIKQFYVPPYPGDEGISIGCAVFGYSYFKRNALAEKYSPASFMPYFGKLYSNHEILTAIESFNPWIQYETGDSVVEAAKALSSGKVVAWFNGRSEFGPRALGNRSILADPRQKSTLGYINKVVKKREAFRPFAPSVLAEKVSEQFYDSFENSSPFMSMTRTAINPESIGAVVHVDGSARLQTLQEGQNPEYYKLISQFEILTGIPMVLNTSFNVAGEPIVESPQDALNSFLSTDGIDCLIFPGFIVRKKDSYCVDDSDLISSACLYFRSEQTQDSYGSVLRVKLMYSPIESHSDNHGLDIHLDKEYSAELMDSFELEILELIQNDGSMQVKDIYREFLDTRSQSDTSTNENEMPTEEDIRDRLKDLFRKRLITSTKGNHTENASTVSNMMAYDSR